MNDDDKAANDIVKIELELSSQAVRDLKWLADLREVESAELAASLLRREIEAETSMARGEFHRRHLYRS
jgi:hypothetical protein